MKNPVFFVTSIWNPKDSFPWGKLSLKKNSPKDSILTETYHRIRGDTLDLPPTQDASGKWRFRLGFPTKNGS